MLAIIKFMNGKISIEVDEMSAHTITSDFATFTKMSKDTIMIKPGDYFSGTELNDEKLNKLYSVYCDLLVKQYNENIVEDK